MKDDDLALDAIYRARRPEAERAPKEQPAPDIQPVRFSGCLVKGVETDWLLSVEYSLRGARRALEERMTRYAEADVGLVPAGEILLNDARAAEG